MKKKSLLLLIVLFALQLLLTTTMGAVAQAKKWRLRSADVMSIDAPYPVGMNKFAELMKEKTQGEIMVKHYPAGQLGKDQAIIEGVKLGTIDLAVTGGTAELLAISQFSQMWPMVKQDIAK